MLEGLKLKHQPWATQPKAQPVTSTHLTKPIAKQTNPSEANQKPSQTTPSEAQDTQLIQTLALLGLPPGWPKRLGGADAPPAPAPLPASAASGGPLQLEAVAASRLRTAFWSVGKCCCCCFYVFSSCLRLPRFFFVGLKVSQRQSGFGFFE